MAEQTRRERVLGHMQTSAWTLLISGAGFYFVEARNHVTREEFQKHLDATAPMIRQMDEERGRVEARLAAVEARLAELVRVVETIRDRVAPQAPR